MRCTGISTTRVLGQARSCQLMQPASLTARLRRPHMYSARPPGLGHRGALRLALPLASTTAGRAGSPQAGGDDAARAAVQQQLKQLNTEAAELTKKVDAARADWLNATNDNKDAFKTVYEDLKNEKKELDARRKTLEAQLTAAGGGPAPDPAQLRAKAKVLSGLKEYAKLLLATGKKLAARTPEQKGADADDPFRVVELSSQDLMLRSLPLPTSMRARKLVNRRCYDQLMDIIEQRFTHPLWSLVLTGDPGTGKSTFGIILMSRLAQLRQKFVYKWFNSTVSKHAPFMVYFDFTDLDNILVNYAMPMDAAGAQRISTMVLAEPGTWQLVDGKVGASQFAGNARTIVMTSPNQTNWSEYAKTTYEGNSAVTVKWVPAWGKKELLLAAQHVLPTDAGVVESRFADFGGSVRFVLANKSKTVEALLSEVGPEDAVKIIMANDEGERSTIRHTFVTAQVDAQLNFQGFRLPPSRIAAELFKKAEVFRRGLLAHLFRIGANDPKVAGMLQSLFEENCHMLMVEGVEAAVGVKLTADSIRHLPPPLPPAAQQQPPTTPARPSTPTTPPAAQQAPASPPASPPTPTSPPAAQQAPTVPASPPVSASTQEIAAAMGEVFNQPKLHCYNSTLTDLRVAQQYVQPAYGQGAWDAFICSTPIGFIILQYTYDPQHDVKIEFIQALLKRIRAVDAQAPVHLVFGVPVDPPLPFQKFKWRPYNQEVTTTTTVDGKEVSVTDRKDVPWDRLPAEVQLIEQWVVKLPTAAPSAVSGSLPQLAVQAAVAKSAQLWQMSNEDLDAELAKYGMRVTGSKKFKVDRILEKEGLLS